MQLDDRKTIILQAIIRNYLETGEPVGSRTISKYTDLNLSSATIRNEMADLEEMGYIIQPHTSAGRIPSDKGYRFYVDTMMATREQEVNEMKDMLLERQDKLENLLKQVVKTLAQNTQYATMISAPQVHRNKVKFIQLSRVDAGQILAVIVAEGNVIKVTGLPTGAAYTITESGLDAEKYTTAWTLDGETLSTERTLPTQTVGAADTALTVTNTRSSIAPTGLLLDAAPYGAMLALAAGSGLVFFRKRRRED